MYEITHPLLNNQHSSWFHYELDETFSLRLSILPPLVS